MGWRYICSRFTHAGLRMQKKVEDLIEDIRKVLHDPLNAYLHELLAANDSLVSRVEDTRSYHEARESVVNEIYRTLSTMKLILRADSNVVKRVGWGLPLHELALRFNGPIEFLSHCTLPEITPQTKTELKKALMEVQTHLEALIDPDELSQLKEEHRAFLAGPATGAVHHVR